MFFGEQCVSKRVTVLARGMIGQARAFDYIRVSLETRQESDERLVNIGHYERRYVIALMFRIVDSAWTVDRAATCLRYVTAPQILIRTYRTGEVFASIT